MGWRLGSLVDQCSDLRQHIHRALENALPSARMAILAEAVAKVPTVEGLLLFIRLEMKHNCALIPPESERRHPDIAPGKASPIIGHARLRTGQGQPR